MNKQLLKNLILSYIILLIVLGAFLYIGAFKNIRNNLSDKVYTEIKPLSSIVIIEIDDQSINEIGRWPWNRSTYLPILNKMNNARVVAMDISLFENSFEDEPLRTKLLNMSNVILASEIHEDRIYYPVFDTGKGYVNLQAGSDGIIREVYLSRYNDEINNFAFEVYKKSWNLNAEIPEKIKRINFPDFSKNRISFVKAINSKYNFDDKIVFIGASAANLHDSYFVPSSSGRPLPGVEIHASIVQNLILDNFINQMRTWTIYLLIFIGLGIGLLVLSRLKISYNLAFILVILVSYASASIFSFNHFDYLFDLFYFPLSIILSSFSGIGVRYLFEKKHNQFITGAFGKYISKDLLKEIIDKNKPLKLGGQKQEITTFFSDIRGFTSLSEKVSPVSLVKIMNTYLSEMTNIIMEHKGTVDKFIGDAIMAIWNAPVREKEHAVLACRSAIAQINKLEQLNKKWSKTGVPSIKIGCGINTGEAVVGNMGSNERFAYTAIGDSVNLASRLESLTKYYGVSIIVSESTYELTKKEFKFRKLDKVKVKGKQKPVEIYDLCIEYDEKLVGEFESGLEKYYSKNFKDAKIIFEKLYKNFKDKTSQMFAQRCNEYILNGVPSEWDGSYEMKTK